MDDNLIIENLNKCDVTSIFLKLLQEDDIQSDSTGKDECYITRECLTENYIKLNCGHTFNYIPLFNEVKSQKFNKSSYNITKLKINQLQCPYCRVIHNNILPKISNTEKAFGVNYPEVYTMKPDQCTYTIRSGKRKNTICGDPCFGIACKKHQRYFKVHENTCTAILKSGKNKGCKCNCSIYKDGYCKRHHKNIEIFISV